MSHLLTEAAAAERRRIKRQQLEDQLRQLEEEERQSSVFSQPNLEPSDSSHHRYGSSAAPSSSNPQPAWKYTGNNRNHSNANRASSSTSTSNQHYSASYGSTYSSVNRNGNVTPPAQYSGTTSPANRSRSSLGGTAAPPPSSTPLPSREQVNDYLIQHMHQPRGLTMGWTIENVRFDVYELFSSVIKAGGSSEVTRRDLWPVAATLLHIPAAPGTDGVRSSPEIGQLLRKFFLEMLGGFEILWDQTKLAESGPPSAAISKTAQPARPTPQQSSLRNSNSTSAFVDNLVNSGGTAVSQTSRQQPQIPPITTVGKTKSGSKGAGSSNGNTFKPPSTSVNHQRQYTQTMTSGASQPRSQVPRNQSHRLQTGQYGPAAPLPTFPSSSVSPAQSNRPVPLPPFNPETISVASVPSAPSSSKPSSVASNQAATTNRHPTSSFRTQPIAPQPPAVSALTNQDQSSSPAVAGDWQPPKVANFLELVSSKVLPLPIPGTGTSFIANGNEYEKFAARCQELRIAVKNSKTGDQGRMLSSSEVTFWNRLVAILKNNPTVVIPGPDYFKRMQASQALHPKTVNPADLLLPRPTPPSGPNATVVATSASDIAPERDAADRPAPSSESSHPVANGERHVTGEERVNGKGTKKVSGRPKIPRDENGDRIYPIGADGNPIVPKQRKPPRDADRNIIKRPHTRLERDENGSTIRPLDQNGNPIPPAPRHRLPRDENGKIIYPLDEEGNPIRRKRRSRAEIDAELQSQTQATAEVSLMNGHANGGPSSGNAQVDVAAVGIVNGESTALPSTTKNKKPRKLKHLVNGDSVADGLLPVPLASNMETTTEGTSRATPAADLLRTLEVNRANGAAQLSEAIQKARAAVAFLTDVNGSTPDKSTLPARYSPLSAMVNVFPVNPAQKIIPNEEPPKTASQKKKQNVLTIPALSAGRLGTPLKSIMLSSGKLSSGGLHKRDLAKLPSVTMIIARPMMVSSQPLPSKAIPIVTPAKTIGKGKGKGKGKRQEKDVEAEVAMDDGLSYGTDFTPLPNRVSMSQPIRPLPPRFGQSSSTPRQVLSLSSSQPARPGPRRSAGMDSVEITPLPKSQLSRFVALNIQPDRSRFTSRSTPVGNSGKGKGKGKKNAIATLIPEPETPIRRMTRNMPQSSELPASDPAPKTKKRDRNSEVTELPASLPIATRKRPRPLSEIPPPAGPSTKTTHRSPSIAHVENAQPKPKPVKKKLVFKAGTRRQTRSIATAKAIQKARKVEQLKKEATKSKFLFNLPALLRRRGGRIPSTRSLDRRLRVKRTVTAAAQSDQNGSSAPIAGRSGSPKKAASKLKVVFREPTPGVHVVEDSSDEDSDDKEDDEQQVEKFPTLRGRGLPWVEIRIPRRAKKPTRPVGVPFDRAVVVLRINKQRRKHLIEQGAYDPFRDDLSDEETFTKRHGHSGLRPVKNAQPKAVKSTVPRAPETIPERFLIRPGPAVLEPYASALDPTTLLKRSCDLECGWKGCDAELASEELLIKHILARKHAAQARFKAGPYAEKFYFRCKWYGCEEPCFEREAGLMQHIMARHVSRLLPCPYEDTGCDLNSPTLSHLARHVMKNHDSPSDQPRPLADLSSTAKGILAQPPSLPVNAPTEALTTPAVHGSTYSTTFRNDWVKQKVQSKCFGGENPILHVEHPPHMLEHIDDAEVDEVPEIIEIDDDDDEQEDGDHRGNVPLQGGARPDKGKEKAIGGDDEGETGSLGNEVINISEAVSMIDADLDLLDTSMEEGGPLMSIGEPEKVPDGHTAEIVNTDGIDHETVDDLTFNYQTAQASGLGESEVQVSAGFKEADEATWGVNGTAEDTEAAVNQGMLGTEDPMEEANNAITERMSDTSGMDPALILMEGM